MERRSRGRHLGMRRWMRKQSRARPRFLRKTATWASWAGPIRPRRCLWARFLTGRHLMAGESGNDDSQGPAGGPAFARDRTADGRHPPSLAASLSGNGSAGGTDPVAPGRTDRPAHHRTGGRRPVLPYLPLAAGLSAALSKMLRPALYRLWPADRKLLHPALCELRVSAWMSRTRAYQGCNILLMI